MLEPEVQPLGLACWSCLGCTACGFTPLQIGNLSGLEIYN